MVGALVAIWVTGYIDRRKVIYAAQTEILKWLDSTPDRFLDQHHGDAMSAIRDPLFTAIPYLRSEDQRQTKDVWLKMKSALDGKTYEKNEFLDSISEYLGTRVVTKEDAFRRVFEDLNDTLAASGRILR